MDLGSQTARALAKARVREKQNHSFATVVLENENTAECVLCCLFGVKPTGSPVHFEQSLDVHEEAAKRKQQQCPHEHEPLHGVRARVAVPCTHCV